MSTFYLKVLLFRTFPCTALLKMTVVDPMKVQDLIISIIFFTGLVFVMPKDETYTNRTNRGTWHHKFVSSLTFICHHLVLFKAKRAHILIRRRCAKVSANASAVTSHHKNRFTRISNIFEPTAKLTSIHVCQLLPLHPLKDKYTSSQARLLVPVEQLIF